MTNKVKNAFRPDINGLRAWAVVSVILYHFGVPGFDGGFIGVDIFFVISGFLMTGIVLKGLERDTFSLLGFYLARARRILPALIVLCAVLLALGWFVLLPPDYKMLSTHSVYALTFLSNVEFWKSAGYFDVASHEKWLLHTWSLSVEWQFYLVLPVVLWVVWRIKPGRVAQTWTVGLGLLASLVTAIVVTDSVPTAAFYLLHTRAWEMLAGGLVFLLGSNLTFSPQQRRWLEATGLLLMVLAIAVFSKDTTWPGWRAMLPVVAAVLVLLANRSSVWTSSRLTQWLGDRSYSLYLWHWPAVVALTYFSLADNPLVIAGGLLFTGLLGHLSYRWVENTSRQWLEQRHFVWAAGSLVAAAAVVAVPAVGVWKQQGLAGRFAPAIELAAAEANNFNSRREACHIRNGMQTPSCVYGGTEQSVIIVGDSHANALITGLSAAHTKDTGVVEWTYNSCPFILKVKKIPTEQARLGGEKYKCTEFIESIENRIIKLPKSIPIVIANRYAASAIGANENSSSLNIPSVFFSKIYSIATPEFVDEFSNQIINTACNIAKNRTVYMVRPIPEIGIDVPKTLSRRLMLGINDDITILIKDYQKRNSWVWEAQDAARLQCGIKILDPIPYLCEDGRCYGSKNGRPLYHDDDHLSEFGNKLLVPMFAEVFKNL